MTTQPPNTSGIIYLRLKQVTARTGLSRSSIYNKMDPKSAGHDPHFPRQVKLGASAVGWVESEIEAWLASRLTGEVSPVERPPLVVKTTVVQTMTVKASEGDSIQSEDFEGKRVEIIRQILEGNAKKGALVFYGELMKATMLSPDTPSDWQVIDQILADLSKFSYAEHGVLLDAHVRMTRDSTCPRKGFFELAESLGHKCDDRNSFAHKELLELFAQYCHPKYKTAKKFIWIEVRGGRTILTCPN